MRRLLIQPREMRRRGQGKGRARSALSRRTNVSLHSGKPETYTRHLLIRASRRWAMSFLSEVRLEDKFGPFVTFQEALGFVPNLLQAQTLLPRVVEAQAKLESAVRLREGSIPRVQKERILLSVAADRHDAYCVALDGEVLSSLGVSDSQLDGLLNDSQHADLSAADLTLLQFCLKLSRYAPSVRSEDERLDLPARRSSSSSAYLQTGAPGSSVGSFSAANSLKARTVQGVTTLGSMRRLPKNPLLPRSQVIDSAHSEFSVLDAHKEFGLVQISGADR
jgi:alkylhydroperoxidase family enzyme